MSENDWIKCSDRLPPERFVVETKIDDKDGGSKGRNLQRIGRSWFTLDGVMRVYYTPTHWRPVL